MNHFKFDPLVVCLLRWIPFEVAKPLLDQKPYVVLSDFSLQQNGESSPVHKAPNDMELEHDDDFVEEPNDANMDEDGEMIEAYSDSSDDDFGSLESSGLASSEMEDGDVTNILFGIGDSRMRYKVCTVILLLRFRVGASQSFTCEFIFGKTKEMHTILSLVLDIEMFSFLLKGYTRSHFLLRKNEIGKSVA